MINRTMLQGNWDEIKGQLRKRWGQLTNDELQSFHGDVEQLVGLIERKTGEKRQAVEQYLDQLTSRTSDAASNMQDYVHQAAQRVQEGMEEGRRQATEALREGYDQAEEWIRRRPSESVAVCFGVGLAVGLMLGLTIRGR